MINLDANLILIKGEDKTADIDRWQYDKENGKIEVFYKNGRCYAYNPMNIKFFKDPSEIDIKNTAILKQNKILSNIEKALKFDDYTRIYYKSGYKDTINNHELAFLKSALIDKKSNDYFEYLKQLANYVSLKAEAGTSILGKRYEKIDFIREDCVLASYLSGNIEKPSTRSKVNTLVFPFGFNISQKQAVMNAMDNQISIIEGPPGTGKTQTILNIIANAVMNGESVAVVSSNNSATQNVMDKLEKYGVGFIGAYLGSGMNKKHFIESQNDKLPDVTKWIINNEEYQNISMQLQKMQLELDRMLEVKNELSFLKQEYDNIKVEYEHFNLYYDETNDNDIPLKTFKNLKSSDSMKIWIESNDWGESISFIKMIINFLRFGIIGRKFYKNNKDRIIAICQKRFYDIKLNELERVMQSKIKLLDNYNFDEQMKEYSEYSMKLFKAKLGHKYEKIQKRYQYDSDDLWKNSEQFIADYPVILSTTYSVSSSLSSKFIYDYVIIDEASQVDLVTGALAFSCAKKTVIVGDLKQLPNVIKDEVKKETDRIFGEYNIPEAYKYSNHSLLLSASQVFCDAAHTLLREHYRCHPQIIGFCNQKFYNGQLIILTEECKDEKPLAVYKTVKGNHSRDRVNLRQIDVIKDEIIPNLKLDVMNDTIGIVTPYRNQTIALQKAFEGTNVKADTVDKFQGQECNQIILSTVDDEISEFSDEPNRLNVAVSRAIKQLIVVTDGNDSTRETNIGDLIGYIQYNNFDIIQSETYSVFDYLYKCYAKERMKYLQNKSKISEYDSENLMYYLIKEILELEMFLKYDVAVHTPLRMILRDLKALNENEISYVMNINTHVDFLLFSKLSKQSVLVIEVDGYAFHNEGTKQSERDKIKNVILEKYNIPYIRLRTNESGEKCRIIEALKANLVDVVHNIK